MYKIKKSQFIVILVAGATIDLILFLFGIDEESLGSIIFALVLVGFLVFYAIGWKNYNKNNQDSGQELRITERKKRNIKNTKIVISSVAVIVFIIILIISANNNRNYIPTPIPTPVNLQDYNIPFYDISININGLDWSVENLYNKGNKLVDQKTGIVHNTTEGKFMEAVFVVNNKTENPRTLPALKDRIFKFLDDKNRNYYPFLSPGLKPGDSEIDKTYWEYGIFTIKPGIPFRFSIFFEVAKDTKSGRVIVSVPQ